MKKSLSRSFTSAAVVALIGAALILPLWLTSFHWQGTYFLTPTKPPAAEAAPLVGRPGEWRYQWALSFGGGAFQVLRLHAGVNEVQPAGWSGASGPYALSRGARLPATADFRLLGVRYFDCPRAYSSSGAVQYWSWGFRYVTLPGWIPVIVLGAPSAGWLLHRRRQKRRDLAGRCLVCGYDLRATPDKCPECGTVPSPQRFAKRAASRHDRQTTDSTREVSCPLLSLNRNAAAVP